MQWVGQFHLVESSWYCGIARRDFKMTLASHVDQLDAMEICDSRCPGVGAIGEERI